MWPAAERPLPPVGSAQLDAAASRSHQAYHQGCVRRAKPLRLSLCRAATRRAAKHCLRLRYLSVLRRSARCAFEINAVAPTVLASPLRSLVPTRLSVSSECAAYLGLAASAASAAKSALGSAQVAPAGGSGERLEAVMLMPMDRVRDLLEICRVSDTVRPASRRARTTCASRLRCPCNARLHLRRTYRVRPAIASVGAAQCRRASFVTHAVTHRLATRPRCTFSCSHGGRSSAAVDGVSAASEPAVSVDTGSALRCAKPSQVLHRVTRARSAARVCHGS